MGLQTEHVYTCKGRQRAVFLRPECAEVRFGVELLPGDDGVVEGSELAAGFVFGPPEDGVAYFDVVCAARAQGKWGNVTVLRSLFHLAFVEMGLRCVWVQPENKAALRAALQAGFAPACPLDADKPVLVMTPGLLPEKFKLKGK